MIEYKDEIVHFSEPKTMDFFPNKFSNEIYFSDVREGKYLRYTSSYSIKYVLEGYERYGVGKQSHEVRKGQYLIINDDQIVENLESDAKALSIFLDKKLVDNVLMNSVYSQERLLENPFLTETNGINFFENVYPKNDMLGVYLDMFYRHFIFHENFEIHEEVFYSIASNLVCAQTNILNKIGQIKRIKYSTRCELFKRVSIAKSYIEDNLNSEFNLDILSRVSFLSKFQLIRIFKEVYKATPYNYYLSLKISKSKQYLKNTDLRVVDIASLSGFTDAMAFSKRFKLLTGKTPLQFKSEC